MNKNKRYFLWIVGAACFIVILATLFPNTVSEADKAISNNIEWCIEALFVIGLTAISLIGIFALVLWLERQV